jgi:hypothetical protein
MRGGRKVLLSAEVMFALVAVVAALTLARSLWTLVSKELGFEAHRLVVSTRPVGAGAAQQTRPARAALFEQQFGAVRELPEVRSTAATGMLPAAGAAPDFGLFPRGQGRGGVWTVSAGFFRTMGIPVMQGREFEERESFEAAPVGVLNAAAARVLFPDGRAIGRQVSAPQQPARTIVGIVADARQSLKDAAEPAMYVPFDRTQFRLAQMIVDADDTPAVRDRIRSAITRVAADTDVTIEPVTALLNREVEVLRFTMALVTAFAALTLGLSVLGVYGVITFLAGERIREYGVRVALGATERAIGLLVLRQAMPPIGAGILMGMLAAGWAAKLLESQILDVVPAGTLGLVTAAVVLLACGLAAAAIPALRATRVDPVVALRAE